MIRQNLHTHSRFSDGENTCEEIILAAIEKGFTGIGFSEHAYTPYDSECCIKKENIPAYFAEAQRLKLKYAGIIDVFLGFELDADCHTEMAGLDYTIGSKHYFFNEATGEYYNIDYKHDIFQKALGLVAGGDIERMARMYYDGLCRMLETEKPDIAGHIDLITKLNADGRYFDTKAAWYVRVLDETAACIARTGCIVEVNTGGIYRGATTVPYPAPEFLARLFDLGVPVTVSSDSHNVKSLDFWFAEAESLLRKTGYRSVKALTAKGFVDVEI